MYCPSCEFEIKPDVTECPICGGALVANSGEKPNAPEGATGPEGNAEEEQKHDSHVSDLILEAKDTIDELDHMPEKKPSQTEPFSDTAIFAPPDSTHRTDDLPTTQSNSDAQSIFGTPPDMPQTDDEVFLLDDAPFLEESKPLDAGDDTPEKLSPDALFADEMAASPTSSTTNPFIDEVNERKLTSSLDAMVVPPEKHGADTIFPHAQDGSVPAAEDHLNLNDTTQGLQTDAIQQDELVLQGFDEPEDQTLQAEGSRSKSRFILILFLILIVIAGAYAVWTYVLKDSEPSGRIQKRAPERIDMTAAAPQPEQQAAPPETEPPALTEQLPETPDADGALPVVSPEPDAVEAPEPSTAETEGADGAPDRREPDKPDTARTDSAAKQPEKAPPMAAPKKPVTVTAPDPAATKPDIAPAPDKTPKPAQPFSLHVASFKTRQTAQNEIKRLRSLGFEAYLETVDLGAKGIWHRVKVGYYATRDEARQALNSYTAKHPGAKPLILKNQ
jgi:cell division protein FtsN